MGEFQLKSKSGLTVTSRCKNVIAGRSLQSAMRAAACNVAGKFYNESNARNDKLRRASLEQ